MMISVQNLVFEYPGVRALDNISFSIARGDIMALVGPNGAGKTTLLRCLAALDTPVSGQISLGNINVLENPLACHRKVGYLPDFYGLYSDLSVRQCLQYMALAHQIADDQVMPAVERAAGRLLLADRLDQKVGNLSRGLKQRVAIAQAIVHEPEVLLLDEPASGLDPEARKSLSDLFLQLRDQGMTLVVSSHILAELEDYCTDMLIVRKGRIIEHKFMDEASQATAAMFVQLTELSEQHAEWLRSLHGLEALHVEGTTLRFRYDRDAAQQHALLKSLLDHGLPVCAFGTEKQNMQDAYLQRIHQQDTEVKP